MSDTAPQTAAGKVLWDFTMSLDNNPGGVPVRLHRVGEGDPTSLVNVRYRPVRSRVG